MGKSFVVLGMHRSATSLVAKGLAAAGVEMGERLLPAGRTSPEGHYEDMDYLELNQRILRAAGGSWKRPPPHEAIVDQAVAFSRPAGGLCADRDERHDLWGWKEPRTVLTLPAYEPYLGDDPHLVCVFRKPIEVARSLQKRNNFTIQRGLGLAYEYDRRIIEAVIGFLGL